MDEASTRAAISVMDQIMIHPIAKPFLNPIDPEKAPEGYFDKIKNPQDLNDIRTRLQTKKYLRIQDWLTDVEYVWSNAELFSGASSPYGICANKCRELFKKYKSELELLQIKNWCSEIYKLKTQILQLKNKSPEKIGRLAVSLGFTQSLVQSSTPFLDKDLTNFINGYRMLSPEANKHMVCVLKEYEPDINQNEEIWLDATQLKLSTLNALRDYIKEKLAEEGKKYPE